MDQSVKDILQTIDDAINAFQEKIPGLQKKMFDELQPLIKELQLKNGKLLNNVENLKYLGQIKNKLERIIISPEYKDAVQEFISSYNTLAALNVSYFKQFNEKYTPAKTLPIIKQLAIEKTITDLVGQGMSETITGAVRNILNTNITTGGSYADLQDQLREHLLNTDSGEGSLVQYTKQITTDSINQYHAQYHAAIAQDLKFNWGRYVGSLLTTSREFCIYLTKKQWVHKSELPSIIEGHIDDHKCRLSKTTGLPYGMIPGTNAANFEINRGGYNCGHQFFWVPDSVVPVGILNEFKSKNGSVNIPKKASEQKDTSVLTKAQRIKENNKEVVDHFASLDIPFYDELAEHWHPDIKLRAISRGVSNYDLSGKILSINTSNERIKNPYYKKKIMLHEGGHAMHDNEKIVTLQQTDATFEDFYKKAKNIIKGKESQMESEIRSELARNYGNATIGEQLGILADTLGGLTKGSFGWGHSKSYYKKGNLGKMEVFAHVITLARLPNDFSDLNESFSELTKLMKEYGLSLLQSK